jgi:hypothetical protein
MVSLPACPGAPVLLILRLFFGSAMVAGIVLGMLAIRRRDFLGHGSLVLRLRADRGDTRTLTWPR